MFHLKIEWHRKTFVERNAFTSLVTSSITSTDIHLPFLTFFFYFLYNCRLGTVDCCPFAYISLELLFYVVVTINISSLFMFICKIVNVRVWKLSMCTKAFKLLCIDEKYHLKMEHSKHICFGHCCQLYVYKYTLYLYTHPFINER